MNDVQIRPGLAGPVESVIQALGTMRGVVRGRGHAGETVGFSPRSEAKRALALESGIVPAERSA